MEFERTSGRNIREHDDPEILHTYGDRSSLCGDGGETAVRVFMNRRPGR